MKAEQLKAWREKLLVEHRRIEAELEGFKELTGSTSRESAGDLSAYSSHMADQGTDTMEREKAFLLAGQKRRRLDEISQALLRIEAGSFGSCDKCGEPIPTRRLERMPGATMCVPCKEKLEKQGRIPS
ncbi:MAG: TraR/DksA C4-type zinc finger protein [Candidatus Latescibacterota bacterium]|nr:MAG: TraR/DksA C4-type zinc finger protein [Candidatus Latescibacterota bacterium]